MYIIQANINKNRTHKFPSYEHSRDSSSDFDLNILLYRTFTDRQKQTVLDGYETLGKTAYCLAMMKICYIFMKRSIIKQVMNEDELRLSFEHQIYKGFKDSFYFSRNDFHKSTRDIEEMMGYNDNPVSMLLHTIDIEYTAPSED